MKHACALQFTYAWGTKRIGLWRHCYSALLCIRKTLYVKATSHEGNDISNHRQLDCLFHSLFWLTAKKTCKLRIAHPLCGKVDWSPVDSLPKRPIMQKAFPCHDVTTNKIFVFLVSHPRESVPRPFVYYKSCTSVVPLLELVFPPII